MIRLIFAVLMAAFVLNGCAAIRGQDVYQQGKSRAIKAGVWYCKNVSLTERQANRDDFNADFKKALDNPDAEAAINCGDG